jgi:hypothetical protein
LIRPRPTESAVTLRSRIQSSASGDGDDVGQQVVHFQHIDAALAHFGDEVEVVALGLSHPEHVIEQQFVAVVRGQPLMGQTWGAHHDFAQFAGFGMDAVLNFFRGHFRSSR